MTDSNHAPLTEVERMAIIIQNAVCTASYTLSGGATISDIEAVTAARAILADPTYARAAEMREALRECADAVYRRGVHKAGCNCIACRGLALLDGDMP